MLLIRALAGVGHEEGGGDVGNQGLSLPLRVPGLGVGGWGTTTSRDCDWPLQAVKTGDVPASPWEDQEGPGQLSRDSGRKGCKSQKIGFPEEAEIWKKGGPKEGIPGR
jgi:hypothetical protein